MKGGMAEGLAGMTGSVTYALPPRQNLCVIILTTSLAFEALVSLLDLVSDLPVAEHVS